MEYIPFTTKYRCTKYDEVLGNTVQLNAIKAYHRVGTFPKVSIFHGYFGNGKTACSNLVIKTLLCKHKDRDGLACNVCTSCKAIDANLIGHEKNTHGLNYNTIDFSAHGDDTEYLNKVVSGIKGSVFGSPKEPYILKFEEMHKVSLANQPIFNKTFENLPDNVIIIIDTNDVNDLLDGIAQRATIKLHFSSPSEDEALKYVKHICELENIKMKVEEMRRLITLKHNNIREILQALDVIGTIGNAGKDLELEIPVEYTTYIDYFEAVKLGYGALFDFMERVPSKIQFITNFSSFLKIVMKLKNKKHVDIPKPIRDSIIAEVIPIPNDVLFRLTGCMARLALDRNITNNIAEDYMLSIAYEINLTLKEQLNLTEAQLTTMVRPEAAKITDTTDDIDLQQLIKGINPDGSMDEKLQKEIDRKQVEIEQKKPEIYSSPFNAKNFAKPIEKKGTEGTLTESIEDTLSHEKTGRIDISEL